MDAAKPKGRKRATRKQDAAPAPPTAHAVANPEKTAGLLDEDAKPQQPRPSLSQRITRSLQQLGGALKAEEGDGWVEVEQHPLPPEQQLEPLAEPEDAHQCGGLLGEQLVDSGDRIPGDGDEEAAKCCGKLTLGASALACRLKALVPCKLPLGGGAPWVVPTLLLLCLVLLTGGLLAARQARSSHRQLAILQDQRSKEALASATALDQLHHQLGELSSTVAQLKAAQRASGPTHEDLQQACNAQAGTAADLAAEVAQLRLAVAAAEAAAAAAQAPGRSDVTPPGDSAELLQLVRREVADALELFAADRTGLPDYALAASGAAVVAHSPAHLPRPGLFQCLRDDVHPEASKRLLAPSTQPTHCLPLVGSSGYVDVRLVQPIHPSAVTYEHVPAAIMHSPWIGSAPRNLTLSGFLGLPPPHPSSTAAPLQEDHGVVPPPEAHLVSFSFNATSRHSVQTFSVAPAAQQLVIDHVRLSFSSNHGRREYTCLYRLRVHGTPAAAPANSQTHSTGVSSLATTAD